MVKVQLSMSDARAEFILVQVMNAMVDQNFHGRYSKESGIAEVVSETIREFSAMPHANGISHPLHLRYGCMICLPTPEVDFQPEISKYYLLNRDNRCRFTHHSD